jgi:hypothetical protein
VGSTSKIQFQKLTVSETDGFDEIEVEDDTRLRFSHDDMVIIWISLGPSLQYSTVRVWVCILSGLTLK